MSARPPAFEIIATSNRTSLRTPVCLTLLALAFGYAVFADGGGLLTEWNISLLLVGLGAVIYWTRDRSSGKSRVELLLLLSLGYLAFQLLPLPIGLLRLLSPERARILDSLAHVSQPVHFAPLAIAPALSFRYLFRVIGYTLAFLGIRDLTRCRPGRRKWLAVIPLIAVALLEAVIGFWQNAAGEEVQGTYVNRNHFAGLLEMALPLALAYGLALLNPEHTQRTTKASRVLKPAVLFISAGAIFAGLLLSFSKMGFIAGLSALFTIAALAVAGRLRGWQRGLAIAGTTILALFLLIFLPSDELVDRFAGAAEKGDAAAEGRWPIWRDTTHLIAAYPVFGSGLGTYEFGFLKYQASIVDDVFEYAHNDYVQLLAELGVAGCLLLAGLLLPIVRNAFRMATHSRDPDTRWLAMGCAGAFTAIGLHSLVDFNTYMPANALMLAWIGGVSAGLPKPSKPAAETSRIWLDENRVALFLAGLLIVYAAAWIVFRAEFRSDPQAEAIFCRFGICDTDEVITAATLGHGGAVAAIPESLVLEALRRDPNSPDRWCDAADVFVATGQWKRAEYCLSRARILGPNIPPALMRISDAYFRMHQTERALEPRAHVLHLTGAYDDLIFDWYREKKIPTSAVLAHGLPEDSRAGFAYLRYLINLGETRSAAEGWNWNLAHRYRDDRLANGYVGFLMNQRDYEAAAQAWARYLGAHREGYLETNWIFNGDFENEPSGSPFDWSIDTRENVEVSRDTQIVHGASHSLRIRFAGQENLNYSQVSQTSFVKPGRYRFEAYVRTEGITTDEGVGFHIFDLDASSRLDVNTERLTGTHDWTKIDRSLDIHTPTKLIRIQIVRQPSLKFDSNITGTVWIANVRLIKE